eukprot:CAMPEP_0177738458 /NCGR_PEP_ID=MMETSP0484_2-20121128/26463_1 /TAXON_ID=354590 /ORGANISM="Rhodomonas lens, Strain RHODO" /LENGTH=252 /DNA_ID=CAMNT_0019252375 /DNA_START=104 /DNA_END=859 /DNA_ORIENTATION=+
MQARLSFLFAASLLALVVFQSSKIAPSLANNNSPVLLKSCWSFSDGYSERRNAQDGGTSDSQLSSKARANLLQKVLRERAEVKRNLDSTLRTYVGSDHGNIGEGAQAVNQMHDGASFQPQQDAPSGLQQSRESEGGGKSEGEGRSVWEPQTGMIPARLRSAYRAITGSADASPGHIQSHLIAGTRWDYHAKKHATLEQKIARSGKHWQELRPSWKPFNPYQSLHRQKVHSGNQAAAKVWTGDAALASAQPFH